MAPGGEIVVVTGASGCLGQHIVKLLQEKDDNVSEIRVFDRKPYQNKLGHEESKPMKHFIADVRDMKSLQEAFKGADCVIHAACVIDMRMYPDTKEMLSTNVDGTKNVIEACQKESVSRLVYTSSTDMVCGSEHIFYGAESTTPIPTTWMIGKYGETKCQAEKLVLDAAGMSLANGSTLSVASLRPTPFYGEEDTHFFYGFLKVAKNRGKYHRRIRSLDERLHICYVGNAAWAHLKAKDKLKEDESINGEPFFITDDTPINDIHDHVTPYMESRGFKVSSYVFPYWMAWVLLSLVTLFIQIVNVVVEFRPDVPTVQQLNYLCSTFFFNRSKAILRLDYQPLYSHEESKKRSMAYYSKVPL